MKIYNKQSIGSIYSPLKFIKKVLIDINNNEKIQEFNLLENGEYNFLNIKDKTPVKLNLEIHDVMIEFPKTYIKGNINSFEDIDLNKEDYELTQGHNKYNSLYPSFRNNDKEYNFLYISQFENVIENKRLRSIPNQYINYKEKYRNKYFDRSLIKDDIKIMRIEEYFLIYLLFRQQYKTYTNNKFIGVRNKPIKTGQTMKLGTNCGQVEIQGEFPFQVFGIENLYIERNVKESYEKNLVRKIIYK